MTARQRAIFISVTCLGMSSLMTQIVTLREFMNILAGNELVIGLVIANWLLLTGCGSYLAVLPPGSGIRSAGLSCCRRLLPSFPSCR